MWLLKNTFGIITLQVGIISFSSVFITLAACILLVNVLSLDKEEPMAWIIMFAFIFTMIIIWSIAFVGAYREEKNVIYTATIFWAVYFILWNVLVIFSFTQQNKNVCIGARCPNALWLINNSWYEYSANEKIKLNNYKRLELTKEKRLIEQMKTYNEGNSKLNKVTYGIYQRNLIVSIILIVLYTIILLYSWMILISYPKEIQRKINSQTQ
ncbi:uncharacterized protein LOC114121783 isoform X1 [Aphis gossypii]|uniref:uncharacterized protein LOC114121783 isoform X1 n=1 Tax=Aphis gossypii TaxID=80765 RepID=UPI00100EBED7|nr:uncharacterized protein LOC114121783 isoform X1 [Aphis gossypii]